jgi:kynurenine formamidase
MRVFDLSQPLGFSTPCRPANVPFKMGMTRRHSEGYGPDGTSAASEVMMMAGHTGTHIDALSHIAHDGKLHGGFDADETQGGQGFKKNGADEIWPLVYDAVLLDIPKVLGVERLEPEHEVTADELQGALDDHGVALEPGMGALVRTGWGETTFYNSPDYLGLKRGMPGPGEEGAQWLHEHQVKIVGSDTSSFEIFHGKGAAALPAHRILLVEDGAYIMETLYLEELAAEQIYEFALIAAPLKIVGATGSPLRPLALVPGA